MLASSLPKERHRRVHILANVTSLSITPTSVGSDVLDEHRVRDRDRIPYASIHHPSPICKHFPGKLCISLVSSCVFYVYSVHLGAHASLDRRERISGKDDQKVQCQHFHSQLM